MAQAQANLLAMTQLVAVLTTVVTGGDPGIAANIAANATQYNYLSHADLERAANQLLGCGNDTDCAKAAYTKYYNLSRQQEINAFIQCGESPTLCAGIANLVAKAQADTALFRSMVDDAPQVTRGYLNQLISENDGFQNALAGVTAGHSAEAVAEYLGVSPEQLKQVTAGVVLTVAALGAAKGIIKPNTSKIDPLPDLDDVQKFLGKEVWDLDPKIRGRQIETELTNTDYKDWARTDNFINLATDQPFKSNNFPLVDFQLDTNVVSLKTVDTRGSSWFMI